MVVLETLADIMCRSASSVTLTLAIAQWAERGTVVGNQNTLLLTKQASLGLRFDSELRDFVFVCVCGGGGVCGGVCVCGGVWWCACEELCCACVVCV